MIETDPVMRTYYETPTEQEEPRFDHPDEDLKYSFIIDE